MPNASDDPGLTFPFRQLCKSDKSKDDCMQTTHP